MNSFKKRAEELVNDLRKEGYDYKQIMDALSDGEYLKSQGYTDSDTNLIDYAYSLCELCYRLEKREL